MDIQNELVKSLKLAVKSLIEEGMEILVEIPNDLKKGDYTSNIAMLAFSKAKNNESGIRNYGSPMELAQKIIENLNSEFIIHNSFRLIEAKEPGFINFYLSEQIIAERISAAVKGFNPKEKTSSLILEFGDLNPFKEPHIGHVRMLSLGESLSRLLEFEGVKVVRANYEGDVGMHVAKCIWGILQVENSRLKVQSLDTESLEVKVNFLAEAYISGAKAFEEVDSARQEIISINNKIYTKDSSIAEIWEKGRRWSLDYFEELYKKLGVKYEKYYFESEVYETGKITVLDHADVFEKDPSTGSGQVAPYIFRGENYGLHTRVFINKEGNPTYEAKDLGLAFAKDKDFPDIDKSIIMTANEQVDYFSVLLKALSLVDKKIAAKTSHLSMGFVNLKEGKMSSRIGNVVGANWLLDETKKRLKNGFKEVSDTVLDDLMAGAVKWSMLKFSRNSNISFSIDESIDLAGNSGPYMQYTYARICSLLKKTEKDDFEAISVKSLERDLLALARQVCQFESAVKSANVAFSPNLLTDYLFNLAQKFNTYYEKEKIIGHEKEHEILVVCKAIQNVLGKGLNLLGISTPEKI